MVLSYQHPIVVIDTTDSTNLLAQEMLLSGTMGHGTVVLAKNQLKGRGQRGNIWHSQESKNLTFSIVLFPPQFNIYRQFELNQFISLAICDYLSTLNLKDICVKWPNDVLVTGKKIAGILLENSIRGEIVQTVIAGIGLNVNQELFEESYNRPPTSLKLATGNSFDLMVVLENLLACIMNRYHQLITRNNAILRNDYISLLYNLNESCILKSGERSWSGIIRGIDESGWIMIEGPDGNLISYSNTELKIMTT